jgi:hypothetical protein
MTDATQTTDLTRTVDSIIAQVQGLVIETDEAYQATGEFLKKCKLTAKTVEEFYAADLNAATEKKKAAEAERKAVADAIKVYTDKLDRAERAAKSLMSAYLTKKEEERRKEDARRRKEEEDRRLAAAIDSGHEEILDKPVVIIKTPEPPKVDGTYSVDVWEYEILDKAKINPAYLVADEKAIGSLVRSQHERAADILGPGVRVYSRKDIRTRV